MKLKTIVSSVALALSAFSANALTLNVVTNPLQPESASNPAVPHEVIYLSGATAPDNFLQDIATSIFTGTPTYYENRNGADRDFRAFAGTVAAGLPLAGQRVLFIKRSRGGSVWGVNPVARAQKVFTINVNACSAGAGTTGSPFICDAFGIDPGNPGATGLGNTGFVPDFGVSDVEPAMFKEPLNTENDQLQLDASETARVPGIAVNSLMMGIVATNAVPATTTLTRAAYGSMLQGFIDDWSKVDSTLSGPVVVCRRVEGSGTQTSYNWYFHNFPCGSAVGASTEPARFFSSAGYNGEYTSTAIPPTEENPAGSANNPFLIDATAGYTVVENPTSGDVRQCLNWAQLGHSHTVKIYDPNLPTQFGDKTFPEGGPQEVFYRWNFPAASKAIGTLSLDSYTNALTFPDANGGGSGTFSFRYMDGAGVFNARNQTLVAGPGTGTAPSKANLISGRYDFVAELTMQYRTVAVTNEQGEAIDPPTGAKLEFIKNFIAFAGSPRYTGNWDASNGSAPYRLGTAINSAANAYASLPTEGLFPDLKAPGDVSIGDFFVTKYSRAGNTCRPPQFFGNGQ